MVHQHHGGGIRTNYGDSDSTAERKLETISASTKNTLIRIKNKGIKTLLLFVKSESPIETRLVEKTFKDNADLFLSVEDGNDIIASVTGTMNRYIRTDGQTTSSTTSSTTTSTTVTPNAVDIQNVEAGEEDWESRKAVERIFKNKIFTYNNNTGNHISTKSITNSLTNFVITATGTTRYNIVDKPEDTTTIRYESVTCTVDDPEYEALHNGEKRTIEKRRKVTTITHYVDIAYINQNIYLQLREASLLQTTVHATGMKITLSNGYNLTEQMAKFEDREVTGGTIPLPFQQCLDKELTHGTTVDVEYTIRLENKSITRFTYLELINYLPAGYEFSPNRKLLTENKTNAQYGWQTVDLDSLYNQGYISLGTRNEKGKAVKLVLDNNRNPDLNMTSGKYIDVKIVVSTVISSLDNFSTESINAAEVLAYRNEYNRRMAILNGAGAMEGIYPGDSEDIDYDDSEVNEVIIIPPTGANKTHYVALIVLVANLIIVALILKYKKDSKMKE